MTTEAKGEKPKFKEDLSRMAGAYGEAMIGKLKQMHVYISGLKGLGLETAKNLILAGPHSVTVQDDDKAQIHDLGTNFYLTPSSVGKPIGECVIETLAELNPNVNVSLHKGAVDTKYLSHFNVVCFTDRTPANKLIEFNEFCRNRTKVVKDKAGHDQTVPDPIVFVYGSLDGASASLFSDFGPKFWTFDPDGLPEKTIVIDHISNAKNGVVTVDGDRSLLLAGDVIKLEEVRGMSDNVAKKEGAHDPHKTDEVVTDINSTFVVGELKHTVPYTDPKGVKKTKVVTDPKRFIIGDTTKLGEYKGGGIGTTVKQGVWKTFKSFKESLINPNFIAGYTDFTKMGREPSLHFARCALFRFQEEKGAWPKLHDAADADHIVELAKKTLAHHTELVEKKTHEALVAESIDEAIVRKVALYARAELTALAALMGGVLAQEITKQTGKFTPMDGWFHFDAFELLDEKVPADAAPVGSRYDHQIAIFGRKWQEKAHAQKLFLVGSGALGCEYLKAIAMIGLGTHGKISVTDDDRIELSNLSRQFLFRREHVGKSKSTSAAEAVKKMNPDLAKSLKAYEIRVEPKTEDTFDDEFWESLDFVLNALDNNIARRYVDTQCVMHYKPLFESGTLGTQANTVICLPGKTPSYSEGAVAGENQGIAQCTLRNFPFLDLHCIEWAREMFNDLFIHGPDAQNSFLEDKNKFYKKLENSPLEERGTLERVKKWLDLSKAPSFELCCQLAIDQFTTFYRDGINDLTNNFPEDARVKDGSTGADLGPFWHGHKRFPRAAPFDPKNDKHLDYVFAAANILASVFVVPEVHDREKVREVAAKIPVKNYKFSGAKIKIDEDKKGGEQKAAPEPESVSDDDKAVVADLKKYLNALDLKGYKKLKAADFEKDDDTNHHIDWITAATNMRCFNYHIKETTRANCRMVAGRIIPAIATTTAMITGFVQLEVYKYIKGVVLESHRAATVNLGTNVFCVELLPDPRRKKTGLDPESYMQCTAIPEGFTVWDKVVIKKPGLTLNEFMNEFSNVHHGAKITTLTSTNGKILYNDFSDKKQMDENKATKLVDLYVAREGPIHPAGRSYIILVAAGVEDKEGNSAVCPLVVYHFK